MIFKVSACQFSIDGIKQVCQIDVILLSTQGVFLEEVQEGLKCKVGLSCVRVLITPY